MLSTEQISDVMYELFLHTAQLAGPILIISMIVGVVISILQAATQIHEQTLTFVPKLIVIALILLLMGSNMLKVLQSFTEELFGLIAG
jgi:flagellar biosynthetic protein FliQ